MNTHKESDYQDSKQFLSAATIRKLAAQLNVRPTKALGQNFVIDSNVIRKIIKEANIKSDDIVLEVGPGFGSMTLGLLDECSKVVAIEIDLRLAEQLTKTAHQMRPQEARNLTVINEDAMKVTQETYGQFEIEQPTALVANLPYNVAVPILLHLLNEFPSLVHGLVMVQEEVADRLVATPKNKIYGIPTIKAAWYGSMEKVGVIKKSVFWPVPRVTSALVRFERSSQERDEMIKEEVFNIVDQAFSQRRKTLRSSLASWAGSSTQAENILNAAKIDSSLRAEMLKLDDFITIIEAKES